MVYINDTNIINEYFDFHKSIKSNFFKWFDIRNFSVIKRTLPLLPCPRFPGFYQTHIANSYNKKTFEEVWKLEEETLDKNSIVFNKHCYEGLKFYIKV